MSECISVYLTKYNFIARFNEQPFSPKPRACKLHFVRAWEFESDFREVEIPMQINFPSLFIQINEKIIGNQLNASVSEY